MTVGYQLPHDEDYWHQRSRQLETQLRIANVEREKALRNARRTHVQEQRWREEAERLKAESERILTVLKDWGSALASEGRITINDFRAAISGGDVGEVRPNPLIGEWRAGYEAGAGGAK